MKNILFVCLGNICRSPAAEGVMNHLVEKAGLSQKIRTDSAGTSGWHVGDLPDARMREHAKRRGIDLVSRARGLVKNDLEKFDYIIAMDKSNYGNILKLDQEGQFKNKVYMMTDFCNRLDVSEVPDPYYGGDEGFEFVLDLVTDGCEGLIDRLKNEIA